MPTAIAEGPLAFDLYGSLQIFQSHTFRMAAACRVDPGASATEISLDQVDEYGNWGCFRQIGTVIQRYRASRDTI
jgi:hypothetical protein